MKTEIKSIILNGTTIYYELNRKKVKNINLRIKNDLTVTVSANNYVSQKRIDEFLTSNSDFILKALEKYKNIEKNTKKPILFEDGETFKFLGRDLELKVILSSKNYVENDESYIYLYVKNTDDLPLKEKTFEKWKKAKSVDIIGFLCQSVYRDFEKFNVSYPEIKFRKMTSRWGSCQPSKNILTFNTALIEAPLPCIEYVVYHEFNHFLHPDHSKNFYNQLEALLPDWKNRKKMLNDK